MISPAQLKKLLVVPGHITEKDFSEALNEAEAKKTLVEEVLIDKGLIRDEQLGKLVAETMGVPFIRLGEAVIDEEVMRMIPEVVARAKGVFAFSRDRDAVHVAMLNPDDAPTLSMIAKRTGLRSVPYFATRRDMSFAFSRYATDIKEKIDDMLKKFKEPHQRKEAKDELTVALTEILLQYGHMNKASDVHIEPHTTVTLVRFRIDGMLHDILELPRDVSENILTRIKILAQMRTDEHRAAQDGRFQFFSEKVQVDVRASIVPVTKGENIVLRLLSADIRGFTLDELGLAPTDLEKIQRAVKIPRGMILVAGPTGSGKTTTIYTMLKILNKRDVHISSIEDPVEYDIEGVSQIQVDQKTNLTFAQGLRAIVRQDPNIIFVGEIRDKETAGIAVNSALTGHLVLSTLHADDAATTTIRFLDMGIEPYLVAATINTIIGQRLVRKICTQCRHSYEPTEKDSQIEWRAIEENPTIKEIFKQKGYKSTHGLQLYKGKGCKVCGNSGYLSRINIMEILEVNDTISELIVRKAPRSELMKAARESGMTTMLENGIAKVLNGITTLEEVLRVVYE